MDAAGVRTASGVGSNSVEVTWRRHRVGEGWTAVGESRFVGAVVCIGREGHRYWVASVGWRRVGRFDTLEEVKMAVEEAL
jgi:hypothetical protein